MAEGVQVEEVEDEQGPAPLLGSVLPVARPQAVGALAQLPIEVQHELERYQDRREGAVYEPDTSGAKF